MNRKSVNENNKINYRITELMISYDAEKPSITKLGFLPDKPASSSRVFLAAVVPVVLC